MYGHSAITMNMLDRKWSFCCWIHFLRLEGKLHHFVTRIIIMGEALSICFDQSLIDKLLSVFTDEIPISNNR